MNDDRLREILPLLRPRSAEPTVFSQTVFYLLWTGLALLVGLYVLRWYRLRQRRRQEFREAAAEAGLTARQTSLLHGIARHRRLKSPQRLLTNAHVFDRQVGAHAGTLAERDLDHPDLVAIAEIRAALDFDDVPADQALSSTRQIDRGQTVMVLRETDSAETDEYVPWLLLERDEGVLTLAPLLRQRDGTAVDDPRPGEEITVRFWREGDTEYSFDSRVVEGVRAAPSLLVEHAAVARMQQRDFYRIDIDFPIVMRILADEPDDEHHADAARDAAIDLLDEIGDDTNLRVETTVRDDDGDGGDRLAGSERVPGRAVNLSAGGLAVEVAAGTSLSEDATWVVDPAFEGDFPLAGLACKALGQEPRPAGLLVKLRFEDLPPVVEKAIVRGVYEHQLTVAGGRSTTRPRPTTDVEVDGEEI